MEMDSLEAPLISNRDPDDPDDRDDELEGATEPAAPHEAADASPPGLFMWLLTFSAGISGLLFGCMASPLLPSKRSPSRRQCLAVSI